MFARLAELSVHGANVQKGQIVLVQAEIALAVLAQRAASTSAASRRASSPFRTPRGCHVSSQVPVTSAFWTRTILRTHRRPRKMKAMPPYAGWKSAKVFPSGSLNHADLPIGVVAIWSMVLMVPMSSSSKTTPRSTSVFTSDAISVVQKRTWVWSALFGEGRPYTSSDVPSPVSKTRWFGMVSCESWSPTLCS